MQCQEQVTTQGQRWKLSNGADDDDENDLNDKIFDSPMREIDKPPTPSSISSEVQRLVDKQWDKGRKVMMYTVQREQRWALNGPAPGADSPI